MATRRIRPREPSPRYCVTALAFALQLYHAVPRAVLAESWSSQDLRRPRGSVARPSPSAESRFAVARRSACLRAITRRAGGVALADANDREIAPRRRRRLARCAMDIAQLAAPRARLFSALQRRAPTLHRTSAHAAGGTSCSWPRRRRPCTSEGNRRGFSPALCNLSAARIAISARPSAGLQPRDSSPVSAARRRSNSSPVSAARRRTALLGV